MKIIFHFMMLGLLAYAGCTTKIPDPPLPSTLSIEGNIEEQQKIMLAFAKAYPDKIKSVEFLNDDWTMLINGKRFYYANGRFLPEELREEWADYLPYDFYAYPWVGTAAQRRALYANPVYSIGSTFLFNELYSAPTEDESWELQVKYNFLGVKCLIHPYIKPMLDKVIIQIRAESQNDPSFDEWAVELLTTPPTSSWNWRPIAQSNTLSVHSYGIAIDLLPKDLKGRKTYWLWSKEDTAIDQKNYYIPPAVVIKAFEDYGFLWGGKWDLIDTMHFEYRPEILLLNGFSIKQF